MNYGQSVHDDVTDMIIMLITGLSVFLFLFQGLSHLNKVNLKTTLSLWPAFQNGAWSLYCFVLRREKRLVTQPYNPMYIRLNGHFHERLLEWKGTEVKFRSIMLSCDYGLYVPLDVNWCSS